MSALDFRCSLLSERLSATRLADRIGRPARTFGMTPNPEARIVLLGSSPLKADAAMLEAVLALVRQGPVGVLAAASAEPGRPRPSTWRCSAGSGVQALDLGVTIDNVDYAVQDEALLETIAGLRGILLCGGNQIRLVETLLHRGEESAVLRAIAARLARRGADRRERRGLGALGGDDRRRLVVGGAALRGLVGHRPPRAGDPGGDRAVRRRHRRPEPGRRQPARAADRRLRRGGRALRHRRPRGQRRGGVAGRDRRIEAAGRQGFLLVEIDPSALVLQNDSFVAEGVRLTVASPGDAVDLAGGAVVSAPGPALLGALLDGLAREAGLRSADDPRPRPRSAG